jgi:putative ATP-dependent endonuclease of OLD family
MRIASVTIRNYRCLKNVTIQVDDYGVFIGTNGSGKSSVFYALDWFFNGTPLSETDIHDYKEGESLPAVSTIEVGVTFADLTVKDRERLEQYGRGDRAEIRRTWYAENKQVKTVGNARQGQGFAEVRAESSVVTMRQKYGELRASVTELPDLGRSPSKDDIIGALSTWESTAQNAARLIEVADSDATQMMGWNGLNVLRECVRFVLIPAATSIAGEVGSASKGTALTELVGAFMSAASARAQAAWLQKHADAVSELATEIRSSVESATSVQADRINARLAPLVPNASVRLTPTVQDFTPKIDATIATAVTIDGITNDVSRQGHGVQRAVMISMFQAIVPDAELTRTTHTAKDGEDEATSDARLADTLSGLPSIIVAIEEPELYQHPIRARAFGRTLHELSQNSAAQVLLATHSPYFVQPEQFAALRRFTCTRGATSVANASFASVASSSGINVDQVQKAITAYVPTEFSEGFFADAVALVEGQTDRVVLEAAARKLGSDLDSRGVTILSVEGKGGLRVARAILKALDIPTYILTDGDFGTSDRKPYKDDAAKTQAHGSHKSATESIVAALPTLSQVIVGALPYSFGEPTVVCADFTIWRDDIEEELGAWTSFNNALTADGITLLARNNKNLLAYRNAVVAADDSDMPENLKSAVNAIAALAAQGAAPLAVAGDSQLTSA